MTQFRAMRELCEVWLAWKQGDKSFTASLGDGSAITAVGRPHRGVCEVHSDRGVEYRHSTEYVLCEPYVGDGDGSEMAPSDEEISQNQYPRENLR